MKNFRTYLVFAILLLGCSNLTNAQSLKDILGKLGSGSNATSTIGNILEGVFSSSDLSLADLQGNWKSSGPAVSFKGDNFLKQAGGKAAAATIETKLNPYFSKYGLTGATLSITPEGTFELKIKKMTLSGTIEQTSEKGVFYFNFQALGKINLGKMKTYVQKSSSTMDVMFDATKLISIVEAVAKFSNISYVQTLSSLLSSYDGMCVGFKLKAI